MWNTGLIVFLGIWMLLAPFLVPGAAAQAWNARVVGTAVVLLGALVPRAYCWEVFAAVAVGAWLCLSAFEFMTYVDALPALHSIFVGLLLIVTGARATAKTHTEAGPRLPV
jgi:hypothetical protein